MARPKYQLPHGEGSFYHRTSDDRWVGVLEAGWTARGTRRRITVTDKNKQRCWDKLTVKRKQLAKEGAAPDGVRAGATVASWATEWLARGEKSMKPSTYKAYAATVRTWIIPTVGRRRLAQLGPQDMRALTGAMDAAGRSSTSQGQAQRLLAKILRDAIVEGHDVPQRALLAPAPKNAVTARCAIPFEDAMRILDVVRARPDASRWVAALLQGQRQGETLGLTWECVDLDAGTITVAWQLQKLKYADREAGAFRVPAGYETRQLHGAWHLVRPKSRAGWRTTPIVPWMRAQLEAIRPADATGLVWHRPDGRPLIPEEDRREWRAIQDAAGVHKSGSGTPEDPYVYYVLHEARHTTATLLLAAHVDPEVIKAILGHSSIVTTAGYQHVDVGMARSALDGLASRLGLQ